jgi:replicative DNA helicase Mcm
MSVEIDLTELIGTDKYVTQMAIAVARGEESLVVSFTDLYNYDPEQAFQFINNPDKVLASFSTDAQNVLKQRFSDYATTVGGFTVRIRGLPSETRIRRINSEHINHTIQISGVSKTISTVQPILTKAFFKCKKCGEGQTTVNQNSQFLQYPQETCSEDKCYGKQWDLIPQLSQYIDHQWMTVQEAIENLPPGQLPRDFKLELKGPLCHSANPGDRVKAVAVVDVLQKRVNDTDKELEIYGRAIDVDVLNQEEQLEITDAVKERIISLSESPNLDEMMVDSVAPSLYGLRDEKLTCLLQLFGGVGKDINGSKIRGDIHNLLIGDPSTGKSQLLRFISELSPRGIFTTGRGSSGAGLTASVIREKDQGYVLEAGALVIADKGFCGIDEIDKMNEDDRQAIHPAMEQQVISISKAGINAELNCRCAIGAAANPKEGRWNPYQNILQNINLPITLLNRFDVIWIIRDVPNKEQDERAATHVVNYHSQGAQTPPIDSRTIKQYILYARHIKPILPEAVGERIKEYYLSLRTVANKDENATILITLRQLESIIRLTEAHARLHLRDDATLEDAEAAIQLLDRSMSIVGVDAETGQRDGDVLFTGVPRSLVEQINATITAIRNVKAESKDGIALLEDVKVRMAEYGIDKAKHDKVLGVMIKDGTIYYPRPSIVSLC